MQSTRLFFCALTLGIPLGAAPALWIDEQFSDGERGLQSPPASAEWFSSSASPTLTVAPGALKQDGGGRYVLAYFSPSGTPAYLAPGETLVVTYRIVIDSPLDGPGALRVGLFNSAGKRIIADKQAQSSDFAGYRGYMGAANPAPSKNAPLRLFKRTQGEDTLIAALTAFSSIGEAAGLIQTMKDGQAYTGTFTIQRSSSGESNTITHGFSGGDLAPHQTTAVDALEPVTVFDTVVIHAGTKAAHGFTLKSVRIETRKN